MTKGMKLVSPSILSADFANLQSEVQALVAAGADWIHVDVMDGHFVPNLTIGIPVVAALKKVCPIPLDVHLMISHPEKYLADFIRAGSDILTFHIEATDEPEALLRKIRSLGCKSGLSLRPKTDIKKVVPLLPHCDLVLVMTVEPGFGGQSFMHDQVDKITTLRREIKMHNFSTLIEVDGGINEETSRLLKDADVLVAGSYIFQQEYRQAIQILKGKK